MFSPTRLMQNVFSQKWGENRGEGGVGGELNLSLSKCSCALCTWALFLPFVCFLFSFLAVVLDSFIYLFIYLSSGRCSCLFFFFFFLYSCFFFYFFVFWFFLYFSIVFLFFIFYVLIFLWLVLFKKKKNCSVHTQFFV